jgi:alpha-L-rhamnosidase
MAMMADLLPNIAHAGKQLAAHIEANGGKLGTGLQGTKDLLPALSEAGHNDLAVQLLQSRQFPSWCYQVAQGATTVWERWDSFVDGKDYGERTAAPMNSFSHPCLGSVCEWMFSHLAGIDSEGVGWKKLVIRPEPPSWRGSGANKPIQWVRAHYDSIRGRIETAWKREQNTFELVVTIPANTTATVYLPARTADGVREADDALSNVRGCKFVRMDAGRAVLSVVPGSYRFTSTLAE